MIRRTIWKDPLARRGWNPLHIGKDAKILLAALDHTTRAPTLWVELKRPDQSLRGIDKAETMMMNMDDIREFRVAVTDDDVEEGETHVGSMIAGIYVRHIYDRDFRIGR